MSQVDIKTLFYSLQEQMYAKLSTNSEQIPHPVSKGEAFEINWVAWLKSYLPKRYSVSKAFVVDCEGKLSDQIDVVIYDRQYSPFVFNQDNTFYIPAESVYAVFEVKPRLNKENVLYAAEKAKSVRSLQRTTIDIPHAGGHYLPKQHQKILSGILTHSSGWKTPVGTRLKNVLFSLESESSLELGCILNGGSFLADYDTKTLTKSTADESLIFFFLKLFTELQKIGTIPALDLKCYGSALDSIE